MRGPNGLRCPALHCSKVDSGKEAGIDAFYGLSENATHERSRITGAGAGVEEFLWTF